MGAAKLAKEVHTFFQSINPNHQLPLLKLSREGAPVSQDCSPEFCVLNPAKTSHLHPLPGIIPNMQVIIATAPMASKSGLTDPPFQPDLLVYDENGLSPEIDSLTAISPFLSNSDKRPKIILAGDPLQLTATARSSAGMLGNFDRSLLTRLHAQTKSVASTHLTGHLSKNYRSGKILVKLLQDLVYGPHIEALAPHEGEVVVINISGTTLKKQDEDSSFNVAEAVASLETAQSVLQEGKTVRIITYYKSQEILLNSLLRPTETNTTRFAKVPISSCENSQGSQASVVILPLHQSNSTLSRDETKPLTLAQLPKETGSLHWPSSTQVHPRLRNIGSCQTATFSPSPQGSPQPGKHQC